MSIQWEVLGDTREGLIAQFEGMDFQSENLRHLLTSADILRVGRVGMAAASVRVRIILDRSRVGGIPSQLCRHHYGGRARLLQVPELSAERIVGWRWGRDGKHLNTC